MNIIGTCDLCSGLVHDVGAFYKCDECGHQEAKAGAQSMVAAAAAPKPSPIEDYMAAEEHARQKCAHITDASQRAVECIDKEQSFLAGVRYARGEK